MDEERQLQILIDAGRAPLAEWPKLYPDQRAMGYLCSYVPGELIHAASFAPIRVRGTAAPLRRADAHLQSFTCALCRSSLDQVLGGELDFLFGTVFAHTCDAMQATADLWRMNTGSSRFVDTVMQPSHMGTPTARTYLLAELGRFQDRLSAWVERPVRAEDLGASIELYDETRSLVEQLRASRHRFTASQFYAILDAAQVMPREQFNPLLAELLAVLADGPVRPGVPEPAKGATDGARLFLAGAVLDEPRLLDLIDGSGAQVVGDDLCSGSRHFYDLVGTEGDPLASLADYYLRRPPCPTKYHPEHDPGRYLLEQVRQVEADGVLFVIEKFCEPHAFDYALVLPTLDRAGVPHLLLEMEQTPSLEALRTRLQAFGEML